MGLSNYQLVLLDNLIYLKSIAWGDAKTVGKRICQLLYADGNPANEAGSGQIQFDYLNYNTESNQCSMDLEEWIQVLKAIEADSTLCDLEIYDVTDDEETGFRAATFISNEENIIIFRGTSSATEWIDNGQGGYSVQTRNQYEALEYVNNLDIVNNNSFVVSGHSKGGNLAQYVALFSTDTLIDKCLAFDGQGFSQELCETEEYQAALERNQANLYMVSSDSDFVNILFNSAVADENRMYIHANFELNPTYYHKPNNIFKIDEKGNIVGLNATDKINTISYFLKDFIDYITVSESDASKKQIVYDSLMGMMAATADKHDDIDVVTGNLLVEVITDLGARVAVELFLSRFGIPRYVVDGVIKVADKTFQMDSLGEILTAGAYKGEASEFVESGAIDLLANYLKGYVNEKTHNLFTLLCAITDQLSGNILGAHNTLLEMMENNMWNDIVEVFEAESNFGVQNIRDEINSSYIGSSTLGEGTRGHVYSYIQEDGGLAYKGTGGVDSIAGTSGDDYLHGGNGIDVIMGGAGDDVIFGGRGDDVLYSGSGSDIFAVNRYDGKDTIYNQSSESELNFIFFGEGITHGNVNYVKDGNDLYIQYNEDYPEECQVKVVNFFLSDGTGNFPNAVDGVMYEDGRILTIQQIFSIVGYEGETPKSLMEKVKAMTQEERDKIFEKYDFLKTEYDLLYGNKTGGQTQGDDIATGGSGVSDNGSGSIGVTTGGNINTDNEDTKGSGDQKGEGAGEGFAAAAAAASANVGNKVKHAEESLLGKKPDKFYEATINTYVDPIVIDLNGDGIFTTSVETGVHFDFNGDGFAEKTAWVSTGDGLLVRDVNNDGSINDGTELFGDYALLKDGNRASSGFQALADLDDNKDGIIDEGDAIYDELKVWMDFDINGKTDDKELFSLRQMGVVSIDLAHNVINKLDANGNIIKSQGVIGGLSNCFNIQEYGFSIDYVDTEYRGEKIDTSGLEDWLPEIKGCGTLLDLSQAMVLNSRLHDLISEYIAEEDILKKQSFVQEILFSWAGVEDVEPGSRGYCMDARCLGVLEKVYGQDFVGTSGPNPIRGAADILNGIYDELVKDIETRLLVLTVYKDALSNIQITYNTSDNRMECNFEEIFNELVKEHPQYYVAYFTDYLLKETAVGDYFDKQYISNQIKENNISWGKYVLAEKIVVGDQNDNYLYGTNAKDVLQGENGNDMLYGGIGDDTYIFNLGDGRDTIREEGEGIDSIVFGEGIRPEDMEISRDNYHLYLTNRTNGDCVKIENAFYYEGNLIETVEFADGTVWTPDYFKEVLADYYGTEENDVINAYNNNYGQTIEENHIWGYGGNDILFGNNGADELHGGTGNDTLYGGTGNDLLEGETGNDMLYGGTGDDTYIFNLGDGQDTIREEGNGIDKLVFGEGIRPEDMKISRDCYHLYLTNVTNGDIVKIENAFYYGGNLIETVEFADGTVWTPDYFKEVLADYYGTEENDVINAYNNNYGPTIEENHIWGYGGNDILFGNNGADELHGGSGNDTLYGGNGNDLLEGETGNDMLQGGTGDDTYIFNLGDGQDTIREEGDGIDRLVFGEGIHPEDMKISRDCYHLYLTNEINGDCVKIENAFYYGGNLIETVEFADGTVWTPDYFKEVLADYHGTEENDVINAYNNNYGQTIEDNRIWGYAGNDTLYGNNGTDELHGGSGNDTLYGGSGNDLLEGETGNDMLYGGTGDDTYIFNLGDGQDTIREEGIGNDRIIFGDGIENSDLMFAKEGNHLKISLIGQDDSIIISDYFYNDNYKVESFQTADGSMLDYAKLNVMIQAMASFEDTTGMMWEDAIEQKNEQANDIVNQWWTKEAI